jgi:hypothetical protein
MPRIHAMKDWVQCSDGELLRYRLCDLNLDVEGELLSRARSRIDTDLNARGIVFRRRFVRHLEFGYVPAHSDKGFAETFAVRLDPKSRWQARYEEWPALGKSRYMEGLIRELAGKTPAARIRHRPGRLSTLRPTLGAHYREKRTRFEVDFGTNYDEDLSKIFAREGDRPAASFLSRHRSTLRRLVSDWTGIPCYTVDLVLKDWVARSRALGLGLRATEGPTMLDVTTALTVRVMQYLSGGHYRVAL